MFSNILVPLDGSSLSEKVISYIRPLAKSLDSRVTLLQVVSARAGSLEKSAEYLSGIAGKFKDIDVRYLVRLGRPEDVIADESRNLESGQNTLIIMATHGRSGLGRWMMGSVTNRVLQMAPASMLVIRPTRDMFMGERDARLGTIVVPLDGSPLAEQAIPVARDLALSAGLPVSLIRVVSTIREAMARGVSGNSPLGIMAALNNATEYLKKKEEEFKAAGIRYVGMDVRQGGAGNEISNLAFANEGNFVVMTTRGRSGFGRSLLGSVADQLVRSSVAPVLLVKANLVTSVELTDQRPKNAKIRA